MAEESASAQNLEQDLTSRFPTAYTILLLLIVLIAALTWIIPAGKYERVMNEEVGREVAVPGTYQVVESSPQGFMDVLLAPTAGFYDPDSYVANAVDVALFILFLGGFFGRSECHRLDRHRYSQRNAAVGGPRDLDDPDPDDFVRPWRHNLWHG